MAASITITHGHANRDLPERVPHLMPFHIQHTGPAPVSTYFRVRPHVITPLPVTSPLEDSQAGPTTAATDTEMASEEKDNAPMAMDGTSPSTTTAAADLAKKAPAPCALRPGPIARLAESAKRFISSFRGRTVHGVEVALPKGYAGLVLRGDASGKAHHPTTMRTTRKTKRWSGRQPRRIPADGVEEEGGEYPGPGGDAAGMQPEDDGARPVRALKPAARFDSFVLWHPDVPVDEGRDEYLRSLSEWVNMAAEVRPVPNIHQSELLPT
ncbi:ribonuclease H2, subunit C [Russula brevipes]|nr:ribonuclease H2, subunit C [Russula brevipes]